MSSLTDSKCGKVMHGPPEPPIPEHHSAGRYFYDRLIEGGEKIAQIDGETGASVTYRQVLQRAINVALELENRGVRRGDLVLICSENCFEASYAIIGVLFTGATLGLANVSYAQDELTHAMSLAQPKVVLCSAVAATIIQRAAATLTCLEAVMTLDTPTPSCKQISSVLAPDADLHRYRPRDVVSETDASIMMYSSGTTGLAKGVMWNHISFLLNLEEIRFNMIDLTRTDHTPTGLMLAPWSHGFGLFSMLAFLANQYRSVFFSRFKEEHFFQAINTNKVHVIFLVPSLMMLFAKSAIADRYDLSSVRQVWSGTAALSKKLEQDTCKRFGVTYVKHCYASTESSIVTIPHEDAFRQGSVGRLALGVTVKMVNPETGAAVGVGEPGELLVRSRKNMLGYRNDPAAMRDAFDDEGFLRTGDILYYDEDMYFYHVDRIKELIKYKGFQVPPSELEGILQSHPSVLDCGVVGLRDELAGELPLAFVVLQPGATANKAELQDFIAAKVSSPKRLRGGVRFVSSLPRTQSGKLMRRKLREMITAKSHL